MVTMSTPYAPNLSHSLKKTITPEMSSEKKRNLPFPSSEEYLRFALNALHSVRNYSQSLSITKSSINNIGKILGATVIGRLDGSQ